MEIDEIRHGFIWWEGFWKWLKDNNYHFYRKLTDIENETNEFVFDLKTVKKEFEKLVYDGEIKLRRYHSE